MKFREAFEEDFWNISNFLSVSRVLLLPVYFWMSAAYREHPEGIYFPLLIGLVAVAVLSDYLDGFLARKLNQITMVGRYLDPICDKIVTLGALLDCALFYGFPWAVFAFCVFREILGVWMGSFLYFKRDIQGRPNLWGKFGVGVVALAVLWYDLLPYFKIKGVTGIWLEPGYSTALIVLVYGAGIVAYTHAYYDVIVHGHKK